MPDLVPVDPFVLDRITILDRDRELSAIAQLIQNPSVMERFQDHLGEWHFKYTGARLIYKLIASTYSHLGVAPTYPEMIGALQLYLRDVSGMTATLRAQYMDDLQTAYAMEVTGTNIYDMSKFVMIREAKAFLDKLEQSHMGDVNATGREWINKLEEIDSLTHKGKEDPFQSVGCSIFTKAGLKEAVEGIQGDLTSNFVPTGWPRIDVLLQGGVRPGELAMILAGPCAGKAQPVDTPVYTRAGWRTLGSIMPGDKVCLPSGGEDVVASIHPQGNIDVWRVAFSDGVVTECCDDHLWAVTKKKHRNKGHAPVIMTLREIRNHMDRHPSVPFHIPMTKPVAGNTQDFELDPYSVGLLLGNGHFGAVTLSFSSGEKELYSALASALEISGLGCISNTYSHKGSTDHRIGTPLSFKKGFQGISPMQRWARRFGLWNKRAADKFIPHDYQVSNPSQRLALLQGLLDTDGHACKHGGVEFCSASRQLVVDAAGLCQSLGGVVYHGKIKWVKGKPYWRAILKFPESITPFRLKRKIAAYVPPTKCKVTRIIESISYVGKKESVCIALQGTEKLYLTNDFIVTHNTSTLVNLAVTAAMHGKFVLYYVMDNTKTDIRTRFLTRGFDVPFLDKGEGYEYHYWESRQESLQRRLGFSDDEMDMVRVINWPSLRYNPRQLGQHVTKMTDICRRQPDLVCVDYLEEMMPVRKAEAYRHQLDENTRELRNVAIENKCALWVGAQGNKEGISYDFINLHHSGEALAKTFAPAHVFGLPTPSDDQINYNGTGINMVNMCICKMRRPVPTQVHPMWFDPMRHRLVENTELHPYVLTNRPKPKQGKQSAKITRTDDFIPAAQISRPRSFMGGAEQRKAALQRLRDEGAQ